MFSHRLSPRSHNRRSFANTQTVFFRSPFIALSSSPLSYRPLRSRRPRERPAANGRSANADHPPPCQAVPAFSLIA
ncbi:hypothetical protein L596_015979 [Steinernema carpocapsae]|uniref:Uncharacterized protein n=1 Tax=Steinernema carpocapsae TaxID=34508 RepID=A0A4U5NH82_STECR|nr:hypothetical protein L596_015979 [Steinernema carpocapsae]